MITSTSSANPIPLRLNGKPFTHRPPDGFNSGLMDSVSKLLDAVANVRADKKGKVGYYDKKMVFNIARMVQKAFGRMFNNLGDLKVVPEFNGKKGWTLRATINPDFETKTEDVPLFDIRADYKGKGVPGLGHYTVKITPSFYSWNWNGDKDDIATKKKSGKVKAFADEVEFEEGFDDYLNSFANLSKKKAKDLNLQFETSRMTDEGTDEGGGEEGGGEEGPEEKNADSPLKTATLLVRRLTFDSNPDRDQFRIDAGLKVLSTEGDVNDNELDLTPEENLDATDVGVTLPVYHESKNKDTKGDRGTFWKADDVKTWLEQVVKSKKFFDSFVKAPLDSDFSDDFSQADMPDVAVEMPPKIIRREDLGGGQGEEGGTENA